MVRLTVALVACLYATLAIWGEPIDGDVAVTRDDTLPTAVPALAASAGPARDRGAGRSDINAREAVQLALAAGEERAKPPAPAAAPVAAETEPEAELWYVTGSRVNLRAGPSTGAAIVGGVSLGDRAEVLSDPTDSWTRIRTERGLEAWIYSRFLSETPA